MRRSGFNISLEPGFSVARLCWMLAYNGVVAVANLRGGERCKHSREGSRAVQPRTCHASPGTQPMLDWRRKPSPARCTTTAALRPVLAGGEYGIEWRDAGSVHNKQVGCTLQCW